VTHGRPRTLKYGLDTWVDRVTRPVGHPGTNIFNDGHLKSLSYTLTIENSKVQPRKLNIVFSRYLKNVTNINYSLSLYEKKIFIFFSI